MKRKLVFLLLPVVFIFAFFVPESTAQSTDGYKMKKIVLDPGHGGPLPGCTHGNYKEKDIVLSVALQVGALIEQNLPDVEVIYTRKTDIDVGLRERGNMANKANADLFVSIHADAVASSSARGSSTWVMGLSHEKSNLEMAIRENSVITYEEDYQTKYEGFDPKDPASYIIFSLTQSAHFEHSVKLANLIQKHYGQHTSIPTSRGVRQNALIVLHRTTMPSVLTEIGFLSNAADRAVITSKEGQARIARAIFNAISEYKSSVEGNAHIIRLDDNSPASLVASAAAANTGSSSASEASGAAVQPEPANAPAFVSPAQDHLLYRVQVSASQTPVARNRFGNYSRQVVEIKIGNYYKYFIGETKTYSEALSLQRQLRSKFKDAFIVAFRNEQPVTITDAMKRN
ncbi:MAG: N-acetylmuramoyl-L-alanine amidase [Rikenellaceae bacterium]|nr:N-acetylmuramoyl-L-alanine amidase [Rikenellaceae bacterium]